jgi:hypothetical protein
MEPNFEDPANKLLSGIVEALRLRYAYQNDIPKPMLNSPVTDDTVGQRWLSEVLSRLRESRRGPI